MIKRSLSSALRSVQRRYFSSKSRVQFIAGNTELCTNNKDVQLRGLKIQGNYDDLPNLIFFPDLFDQVENWVPYFTSKQNKILDYRNVYLVYPRNFGNSDWCNDKSEEYAEAVAGDIERFMYQHRITMATVGGHGFGAKNAMVLGTYKPELVTGVLAYDYSPQDYTYFRSADKLRNVAKSLKQFGSKPFSKNSFDNILEEHIQCKKTQAVLRQNLKQVNSREFVLKYNNHAVPEQFEELINWKSVEYGLFGGRVCFVFPDHSNFVFLNSNTLSMMKVCVKAQGFGHDIQYVLTDSDNPEENHWIYESPQLAEDFQKQTVKFLSNYDGVNVMYMNRTEYLEGHTLPNRGSYDRKDLYAGNVSPQHVYHNWKFSDNPELK